MKSKATFKATREAVGMSQRFLANRLDVDVRSIKRWEQPQNPWNPPQDAWDVLSDYMEAQAKNIEVALAKLDPTDEEVCLPYFSNPDKFKEATKKKRDTWQITNATSRQIGYCLTDMGIHVTFKFNTLEGCLFW